MKEQELETFYPESRGDWRQWLEKHHNTRQSIWLVCYKKKTGVPSISWSEAVDEALCFGWIDSQRKPVNDDYYIQFFCRRKPKSTWSKVNKEKIERLQELGLMKPAGLQCMEAAKNNGSWTILDEVEEGIIPADLGRALESRPHAHQYFLSLSKTDKRAILQWLVFAKRAETRQSRIDEMIEQMDQHRKPKPCTS